MNKIIMLTALLLLSLISVQAQSNNDTQKSKTTKSVQPHVTKGYFSIYKNAGKLNTGDPLVSLKTTGEPTSVTTPQKGYYSMSNHHRKIYKSGVSFITKKPKRPLASKGYYSITAPESEMVKDNKQKTDLPYQPDSMTAAAQ